MRFVQSYITGKDCGPYLCFACASGRTGMLVVSWEDKTQSLKRLWICPDCFEKLVKKEFPKDFF